MAVFLTDNFVDTDGTALTAHTADTGQSWANHPANAGAITIQTNRAAKTTVGTSSVVVSSATAAADCYVETVIHRVDSRNTQSLGPCGRVHATADTMYYCRYNQTSNLHQLLKRVAGTETVIGTLAAATLAIGASRTLRMTMIGTTISMDVDGVEIISVTDSSITAAGSVGLRTGRENTATTGVHYESLEAGDAGSTSRTGTASITEDADTVSSAAVLPIVAAGAVTEAADTVSAAGGVPGGPVVGTAAITEAGDTVSGAATLAIKGAAAITEAGDTLASSAGALPRYRWIYDGDIDSDNPTFSSAGVISGLNESDDESALPLGLGMQDWVEWKGFFCGAQDGNVAGVTQMLDAYEAGIDNLQTYMPPGITVLTKAEVTAITYQSTNETTSGNQKTPAAGYRVPGDSQYELVHACAQTIIAMVQEPWCVPDSDDEYDLLHWHEQGAPTLRGQVLHEAIDLGDCPDICSRVYGWKASKQNDIRDINTRRYIMGHDNGTPADGLIGYGPVAPGTPGPAGALRLVQFGGPSGSSRQEVCCNDDTSGGRAFYLASVVPGGAMGSRIDRNAYASDSKTDQAEYLRAADGVTYWNFGRMAAANNFSPTAGLITTAGGALMQTYIGSLWPDSNRSASIAVTKSWPTGYGDTSNSLSKTDWQAFVTEVMDRYRTPRPTAPAYTSLERGTLSAGSVTPEAPYLIQDPQGLYHVTLAEGVTVSAWKSRWAQGIWGGAYHLSGGMTYSMGLVERVGVGVWSAIGTHGSTFTSQAIPTYADGLTHEIGFQVAATNAIDTTTTVESLGSFLASGTAVNTGVAAIIEAGDTVVSAAKLAIKGAAAVAEGADTVSSASQVAIRAVGAITEAADVVTSEAFVGDPVSAIANLFEAGDRVMSRGRLAYFVVPSTSPETLTITAASTPPTYTVTAS